jgi:hypothetical protein
MILSFKEELEIDSIKRRLQEICEELEEHTTQNDPTIASLSFFVGSACKEITTLTSSLQELMHNATVQDDYEISDDDDDDTSDGWPDDWDDDDDKDNISEKE